MNEVYILLLKWSTIIILGILTLLFGFRMAFYFLKRQFGNRIIELSVNEPKAVNIIRKVNRLIMEILLPINATSVFLILINFGLIEEKLHGGPGGAITMVTMYFIAPLGTGIITLLTVGIHYILKKHKQFESLLFLGYISVFILIYYIMQVIYTVLLNYELLISLIARIS